MEDALGFQVDPVALDLQEKVTLSRGQVIGPGRDLGEVSQDRSGPTPRAWDNSSRLAPPSRAAFGRISSIRLSGPPLPRSQAFASSR